MAIIIKKCPLCGGTGKVGPTWCRACDGTGDLILDDGQD